jgi:hypothetical protein
MKGRAQRRADQERMLAHAKHILGKIWRQPWSAERARLYRDNMARCSCPACRNYEKNPRKQPPELEWYDE